jgi:hypothetical protein
MHIREDGGTLYTPSKDFKKLDHKNAKNIDFLPTKKIRLLQTIYCLATFRVITHMTERSPITEATLTRRSIVETK